MSGEDHCVLRIGQVAALEIRDGIRDSRPGSGRSWESDSEMLRVWQDRLGSTSDVNGSGNCGV